MKAGRVSGGAHITGGGLIENPGRMLGRGLRPRFDWNSWSPPPVFAWLQEAGGIAEHEMRRTFNCGLGFLLCAAPDDAPDVLAALADAGDEATVVGELAAA